MRVIIVSPRFGEDIVGGAERGARDYALRLAARGHDVTVHTTTAVDHFGWAREHPEGESFDGPVRVVRHDALTPDMHRRAQLQLQIDSGGPVTRDDEDEWLRHSGHSPGMMRALESDGAGADVILFTPYLFAHTVYGARIHPERSLVVPCLHDEPYARWQNTQETLGAVAGLIFNSEGERVFAESVLPRVPAFRTVGFGVEAGPGDGARFRRSYGADAPYTSYAGRRERGKGFETLLEWTVVHNDHLRRGPDTRLVVMGRGHSRELELAARHITDIGFVSEQTRQDALAGSLAAVTLSTLESFSFLLLESWLAGAPGIVNAACDVTREHCRASGGGLWVNNAMEYSAAVDRLAADPALRDEMVRGGRAYINDNYTWPIVIERLEAALGDLVA